MSDAARTAATAASATGARLDALRAVALQQHRLCELGLGAPLRARRAPSCAGAGGCGGVGAGGACAPRARARERVGSASGGCASEEYAPPPLTLAQRLGLVEALPPTLSAEEWDAVRARAAARDGLARPCAICLQPFAAFGEQLLLGCAHAFHRACLRSWERHSRRRSCPCCRRLYAQTRCVDDGAAHYRAACAALVQAAWRARAARAAYALRRARADPTRLRAYCASRLDSLSAALLRAMAARERTVDAVLRELDASSAARLGLFAAAADGPAADGAPAGARHPAGSAADASARARARGVRECSVCLQPCGSGLSVLSCSHVFHTHCVQAFEAFALGSLPLACPECRAVYTRYEYSATAAEVSCAPCARAATATAEPDARRAAGERAGDAGGGGGDNGGGGSVAARGAWGAGRISAADIEKSLEERRRLTAGRPRGLLLAQELVGVAAHATLSRQPQGALAAAPRTDGAQPVGGNAADWQAAGAAERAGARHVRRPPARASTRAGHSAAGSARRPLPSAARRAPQP
ncbi:hypothetical protein KFE25_000330 [Diacronema lutheri]|uniref:RING-type domain-containing protein n=1 Tax=Diacronema lutheri TaxID=2081491 RepID=A0A8J5XV05_DIALT|nr:hypothetical protein KFE25_000330 [Diacronema lutheri]